jgi:hypothetical protein
VELGYQSPSRVAWVILCSIVELLSNKVVVEILWTLKGHSLGQSEDQVKVISYLHFILLVFILGGPLSYGSFFYNSLEL